MYNGCELVMWRKYLKNILNIMFDGVKRFESILKIHNFLFGTKRLLLINLHKFYKLKFALDSNKTRLMETQNILSTRTGIKFLQ